jgi:5-formyltetrahydrofolate cyclo-ligase
VRRLALRNSKPVSELNYKSSEINARLLELPEVRNSKTISTYLHSGSEVRTGEIGEWARSNGKRLIVPISDRANKVLLFSQVKSPERELETGSYGIPEPKKEFRRLVPLEEADVILIPGVAWDKSGYRIGYGAGYYDRSINAMRTRVLKVGLAYEFQLVPNVPRSRYDRRVDKIATERRIINTELLPG